MKITPQFGSMWGDKSRPMFFTDSGIPVWMWRKGQRCRFFTEEGEQIGPEHRNVYPAMLSAFAAGWHDPSMSAMGNFTCRMEVSHGVNHAGKARP